MIPLYIRNEEAVNPRAGPAWKESDAAAAKAAGDDVA
jgi:hypothetical protein